VRVRSARQMFMHRRSPLALRYVMFIVAREDEVSGGREFTLRGVEMKSSHAGEASEIKTSRCRALLYVFMAAVFVRHVGHVLVTRAS